MARREQGSHLMVQLQPHLRVGVAHGSICGRAGAPLGRVPRASGLESPPCTLGGAVWTPSLLSIPPHCLQKSLCLPPHLPTPHRGSPPLLLTDGLVLGVCSWAGAEEEMLCQGEKVGCCGWGSGGVGVGVTCSAGLCPQALGLRPLWEVGNQPRPGRGPGTEARPGDVVPSALRVGFRRREGNLGSSA